MVADNPSIELLREWVESLLSGVDNWLEGTTKDQLLDACGRTCAVHYGSIEAAQSIAKSTSDIDERLNLVNRRIAWCGQWRRKNGSIHAVCESCGCPLARDGLISLSPVFCKCSRGYVRAVFEVVLGGPVIVELVQSIGRGDSVCHYVVTLQ